MKQSSNRIVDGLKRAGDQIDKPKGFNDKFVNFLDDVAENGFEGQTKTHIDRMWNQNRNNDIYD